MLKKILILVLCMFIFSGCTKKNAETITFSSWGSATEVKIIKKIIKDFEKENPNINVTFIHIPQNYFQKIHMLFAANTPPDVIFINNLYLPIYASHLENLTKITNSDIFYKQSLESMTYNNILYAVPRDISNQVMYVNLDLLKTSNLQKPQQDWTINDLLYLAQQATSTKAFGISYSPELYWALPYINYFGDFIGGDSMLNLQNNLLASDGIKFYKNLLITKIAPSKSDIGSSTLAQMFIDKKICLYLSGRWMYPKILEKADFNWFVINFPYGKYGVPCDASGWAISKESKHKQAANKFVQFISNKENIELFTQTGLIVPARKECAHLLYNDKHNEKIFIDVIQKSEKHIVTKDYKKITDIINKSLDF